MVRVDVDVGGQALSEVRDLQPVNVTRHWGLSSFYSLAVSHFRVCGADST